MEEQRVSFGREALAPFFPRDFSSLRGLGGIPDALLQAHFKLYEGYVKNFNLLGVALKHAPLGSPEWCEVKRRTGFELNGIRLHELYFENLAPGGSALSPGFADALEATWGSFDHWKDEFKAVAMIRGVGWAILYMDPRTARLSNHWIGLHEEGHPAGFVPILVMDVWEHAFTGMERSEYVDAFFANLHGQAAEERWKNLRASH